MSAQIILTAVNALAQPGECVRLDAIKKAVAAHGWPRRKVREHCETLVRRGFLQPHVYSGSTAAERKPGCYTLTTEARAFLDEGRRIASGQPADGKRVRTTAGGLRLKAWRAMRILGKFTLGDLAKYVATGDEADPVCNLKKYVRALARAGYLVELRRERGTAPTSNGYKRWLLVRDMGPQAPIWNQRARTVTDGNTAYVFPMEAVPVDSVVGRMTDADREELEEASHV